MRMLMAEPIQTLEYLRDSGAFPFSTKEGMLYKAESIDIAIDTMRKYQKIKEYISIPNRYGTMAEYCQKLEYVRKVVEDGRT